jgi:pimeloyl-ACP methyl ester carboxylesterase
LLAGCSTPIGVKDSSTARTWHELKLQQPAVELVQGSAAEMVLAQNGLEGTFRDRPLEALRSLQEKALESTNRDLLLPLSELSCIAGERQRKNGQFQPDYFLASAIYADLYLLGDGDESPFAATSEQFRAGSLLYNYALGRALETNRSAAFPAALEPGRHDLPCGHLSITIDTNVLSSFPAGINRLLLADHFGIRGLDPRNRQSGIGVPLIGVANKTTNLPVVVSTPLTTVLDVEGDLRKISDGNARATLRLASPLLTPEIDWSSNSIPLEADLTAPLAYSLNEWFLWNVGREQFLSTREQIKNDIYLTQPYQKGRIPVLFVHGTFSSPAYWAELDNALCGDPELVRRCQFWHFIYNSGNPVPYSAGNLRFCLTNLIHKLDPGGGDPALRNIVVIGHSQGGLLAKLMATDTGDKLWMVGHKRPPEECELTDNQCALAREYLFYKPLPEIHRIVFIATPHRGSFLANSVARWLASAFLTAPKRLAQSSADLVALIGGKKESGIPKEILSGTPTSVAGMSPNNPWLLALADIPPAPGVKCHSIIPVTSKRNPRHGNDGVVKYSSAHVDYADSEIIVRSGHRCQANPQVTAEVRRILHEHLASIK